MDIFMQIPFWTVFLASVAYMVIGGIWYSPFVLGKAWIRASKLTPDQLAPQSKALVISWASSIVMGYILAYLMITTTQVDVCGGMWLAFLCWTGFVASSWVLKVLYGGVPLLLFAIDTGNLLLTMLAMGALLGWYGVIA